MVDTLKNYTFLPWLRQGIGAEIAAPDHLGKRDEATNELKPATQRVSVAVSFNLGPESIDKTANLFGPGDVVGINPRAIVKTEPRNWITDFEANYLSYIEFYEEDFPWRFTPGKAPDTDVTRLRPWILLIVLAEDEFDNGPAGGLLPSIEIRAAVPLDQVFPPEDQTWAWAHVHINQNVIGEGVLQATQPAEVDLVEQNLANVLAANRDNASSRLLCPRKLKENTAYHAFVVPAFETGRRAGLGLPLETVNGQQVSWDNNMRIFPVYYRWFFRTGTKGDFEFLVDLLEARRIDKRVGVRDMDMQQPNFETDGMEPPFDAMGLEGALRSPQMEPFPEPWPPEGTDFEDPLPGTVGKFLNDLESNVNLQFNLQQQEAAENPIEDPIISPPLYGKWYAKAEKLDVQNGSGWVNELNRDPRYRVPAGVGTQVIQQDQENLMQQAWSQLGDLLRTNQKIRQLQLGLMSSFVMYQKNVLPLTPDQLMTFTQPVQSRVLGSPLTIARQVQESRLPQAALDPAFRKLTRNRGAVIKKVAPDNPVDRPIVKLLNEGTLTAAPPAPEASGQLSLDEVADAIDPKDIPDWLRRLARSGAARWILIAIIVVAVLLAFATGLFVVFIPIAVVAAVLFPFVERLRTRIQVSETFRESSFTPAFVDTIPSRPNFVLTSLRQNLPPIRGGGNVDSVEGANFRVALRDAFNVHQTLPPVPPPLQPVRVDLMVNKLVDALNPAVAIPRRAEFILQIPLKIKDSYLLPQTTLVTVMAHPVFTQPMYKPLRDISSEFLVPNLDLIPNNTISLMETNQRFIESYMVGLNHEMGCELLWREFPTDQRGSYFRQFWDVGDVVNRIPTKTKEQLESELLDITKLHTWESNTELGSHSNRPLPEGGDKDESRVVLVVRGDLLKKYPTVVIYAQRAMWTQEGQRNVRVLDQGNPAETIKHPIFKAEIEPDIRFLGFDLTKKVAKGSKVFADSDPGWFFVLQERPGEPRFGLDIKSDDSPELPLNWNQLAWEHLSNSATLEVVNFDSHQPPEGSITDAPDNQFGWGENAADMAYILYQVPVMVAFHAGDMLP